MEANKHTLTSRDSNAIASALTPASVPPLQRGYAEQNGQPCPRGPRQAPLRRQQHQLRHALRNGRGHTAAVGGQAGFGRAVGHQEEEGGEEGEGRRLRQRGHRPSDGHRHALHGPRALRLVQAAGLQTARHVVAGHLAQAGAGRHGGQRAPLLHLLHRHGLHGGPAQRVGGVARQVPAHVRAVHDVLDPHADAQLRLGAAQQARVVRGRVHLRGDQRVVYPQAVGLEPEG